MSGSEDAVGVDARLAVQSVPDDRRQVEQNRLQRRHSHHHIPLTFVPRSAKLKLPVIANVVALEQQINLVKTRSESV